MEISWAPLFLLPVLAGFKFNEVWEVTRYVAAREDGNRLYFKAAFSGFIICLTIFAALYILIFSCSFFDPFINKLTSSSAPNAGHAVILPVLVVIALVLSPLVSWPLASVLNFFINENYYFAQALLRDEFEQILVAAVDQSSLVMISMSNGKVYVGFVYSSGDPASGENKFIGIVPVSSGYRDDLHKVTFTTFYLALYDERFEANGKEELMKTCKVVIPRSEVQSIRLFDQMIYENFQYGKNRLILPVDSR